MAIHVRWTAPHAAVRPRSVPDCHPGAQQGWLLCVGCKENVPRTNHHAGPSMHAVVYCRSPVRHRHTLKAPLPLRTHFLAQTAAWMASRWTCSRKWGCAAARCRAGRCCRGPTMPAWRPACESTFLATTASTACASAPRIFTGGSVILGDVFGYCKCNYASAQMHVPRRTRTGDFLFCFSQTGAWTNDFQRGNGRCRTRALKQPPATGARPCAGLTATLLSHTAGTWRLAAAMSDLAWLRLACSASLQV